MGLRWNLRAGEEEHKSLSMASLRSHFFCAEVLDIKARERERGGVAEDRVLAMMVNRKLKMLALRHSDLILNFLFFKTLYLLRDPVLLSVYAHHNHA